MAVRSLSWLLPVLLLSVGCSSDRSGQAADDTVGSGVADQKKAPATSFYVPSLAEPLTYFPEMGIVGAFRWENGCPMMGDRLLVFNAGARVARTPDGRPAVRLSEDVGRLITDGDGLVGGGGGYAIDAGGELFGGLREPIPGRCRAVATGLLLMRVQRVLPPSRFAERLYVPMRSGRVVANLAPVSGTIAVRDQCLMLDDRLLILPTDSEAGFEDDGSVALRIAGERYRTTVPARPGDRVEGGGRTIGAADRTLPNLADALLDPIPARCRPAGRQAVLLAPGPRIRAGAGSDYRDPGAMGGLLPAMSPPRPVTDPADCPPGSTLTLNMCRTATGELAEPIR